MHGLLRMLDETSSKRAKPNKFAVLGNVGFDVGNSATGRIERSSKRKAESLGYKVIVADEYRYLPDCEFY